MVVLSSRALALMFGCLSTLALDTAIAQPTASPVRVSDAILVKDDRLQYVDFLVTNDTPLAITAWGVRYTVTLNDGKARDEAFGKDVYKSFVRGCPTNEDSGCFVPPKQARRLRFIASSKEEYASVNLEFEFVIFADGTGLGDDRRLAEFFEHRNADSRGWKQVLNILRAVRQTAGPGIEGARAAIVELEKGLPQRGMCPIRDYEATPRRLVAADLRRGLERPAGASHSLDDMIEMARSEIEMLQPHLAPRP